MINGELFPGKAEDNVMKTIFKAESTVLFQGDSITDWGRDGGLLMDMFPEGGGALGKGYAYRAAKIYELLFPNHPVTFINRGVSGDRCQNLLERYQKDILEVHPDYLSIMIGINDTWRRYDSNDITSKEQFDANLTELLEKTKKDLPDTKLMLIEPFLLPTDPEKEVFWEDLGPKVEVTRRLARKYADVYLPMNGILTNCLIEKVPTEDLSYDGVHLSDPGCAIMAREYLKAWASIEA